MGLPRQIISFVSVGALQWLLDTAVMVALSHAGLAVGLATAAGRIAGAALGFWLNGRYTFTARGHAMGTAAVRRFVVFWLLCTAVGAIALALIDRGAGLHAAWLAKPLVDLVLALAGFLAGRHWIYTTTVER